MKNKVMSANAFVKAQENKLLGMMGDRPGAPKAMKKFNAYMSNDGDAAKRAGDKIAGGLDSAYPMNKALKVD